MRKLQLFLLLALAVTKIPAQQEKHIVKHLKITILSTMLAQTGFGEWGFSALVEADSIKILFDAGGHERTVLENTKELNINLSNVPVLILSHWHDDHTAGRIPLRNAMDTINKQALAITHVGSGFLTAVLWQRVHSLQISQRATVQIVVMILFFILKRVEK